MKNVYYNQWIGTVSFRYEILDNDLYFDPWLHSQPMDMGSEYDYNSYLTFNVMSKIFALVKGTTFHIRIKEDLRNKLESLDSTPHLVQIFESKGDLVYVLFIQFVLGATDAVKEGSLYCSNTEVTVIAYEGPVVELTKADDLLIRLQEWTCGHNLNATNRTTELAGRIGDMTILFWVEKRSEPYYYDLKLNIVIREIQADPQVALLLRFNLAVGANVVEAGRQGTFFYSINIQTGGPGFVSIVFQRLTLRGYMDQSCTYGGLYIVNYYSYGSRHVGGLCLHDAARRFQRLYGRRGLTLNDRVIIYIKQYHLLFLVYAKLRFLVDRCYGLVNLKPSHTFQTGIYWEDEGKQVSVIKERQHYGFGSNAHYRWDGVPYFLGIKRRKGAFCFKLEYVNLDNIRQDETNDIASHTKAVLSVGHFENTRPSRMSVAFWNFDEELKYFDACLVKAFRFFTDNRNDEPYVFLRTPEEEAWVTTAFSAKLGLDNACLVFGGAFLIQVQETGTGSHSQCFSEVGGYLYDEQHPIIHQGVCGNIVLDLYLKDKSTSNRVSFQKPSLHDRCCYLNIFATSQTIPCIRQILAYQTIDITTLEYVVHTWSNHRNDSEIFAWLGQCTESINYDTQANFSVLQTCIDMVLYEQSTCDMKIYYQMSPLGVASNHSVGETGGEIPQGYICWSDSCYSFNMFNAISWDFAQRGCQTIDGSLLSVNSDAEWRFLLTNGFFRQKSTQLVYIGYRTVSERDENSCFLYISFPKP